MLERPLSPLGQSCICGSVQDCKLPSWPVARQNGSLRVHAKCFSIGTVPGLSKSVMLSRQSVRLRECHENSDLLLQLHQFPVNQTGLIVSSLLRGQTEMCARRLGYASPRLCPLRICIRGRLPGLHRNADKSHQVKLSGAPVKPRRVIG